jgi:antitoxin MazE
MMVAESQSRADRHSEMYILVETLEPSMPRNVNLTVQQWGNSLAVRIPAAVARSARFTVGLPVEISVQETGLLVRPVGEPRLTLEQKLARFDPVAHGGEAMVTHRVGREVL